MTARRAIDAIPDCDAIDTAVEGLPAEVQGLLASGVARIVPVGHPDVPADLAMEIARRQNAGFANGAPSVCHRIAPDDYIVVVGKLKDLGHELIHLAQDLVPTVELARTLAEVAAEGQAVVHAARASVRAGQPADDHRDLTWCRMATQIDDATADSLLGTFGMNLMVHPVQDTLALGEGLGLQGRRAVASAIFAHYLLQSGFDDPLSAVAREIVACRHETDLSPLLDLFLTALEQVSSRTPTPGP